MADTLLSIRDLRLEGRTEGGWVPILKGIDLDLARGEVLGLIGESGAGKSTLGLAAMGYVRDGTRIAGGSVTFDGRDLLKLPARERRKLRGNRIAYVAQSAAASFNPAHRLIDQYSEGPVIHGVMSRAEAEGDARTLYAKMQLPDPDEIGFRYPHQVSGGQLQRAMTAMAMASRPDLIIFDEPTTALDVTTQIEVLGAIRDIVTEFDTAAIYITHDLAVVAQMANRIKVMRYGKEVEEAATRQMLDTPQQDYTRSLWAVREFRSEPAPAPTAGEVPVLSASGITAAYTTGADVLHDVSFEVYPGRTLAVVGESGSGKSTMARVITGLLPPRDGEIRLSGEIMPPKLADRSREQLRRVQMIYQMADTALNPRQTLREIVGRPARFYRGLRGRELEQEIRQLLADVELDPDEFIDRRPPELSGGQKQRVGILRALAAQPDIIICDEVTSALDQLVADGILRLLKRLQQEHGLSFMFITHDIATVRAIADYVVVMQNGRVVEQGPKTEMFTPPHTAYTDLLLSSVPEMDPDWLTHRREEMRT